MRSDIPDAEASNTTADPVRTPGHTSPGKPLNVLLLNEFFYPDNQGGTATATSNIARRLVDDHGMRVTAITGLYGYRDPNQRFDQFEKWDGVQIHRVGNPNWGRERPAKRFVGNIGYALQVAWKALTLPKSDVTIVTTAPLTLPIAARLLKKLRGVPYAYVIYDLDPDRTVALKVKNADARSVRLLRKWQSRWLNDADRVVAIGRCMKERLAREYGIPLHKIDVVPVGADPDVIRPLERDTEFRREHGIEGFVVMYSGNFGQYHDFDTLLDAAERLRDRRPEIQFVLVGGGKKRAYVEQQVAQRDLRNVRLFDFVPEEKLSDLLATANINVVTLEPGMEGICVPSKFYSCLASGRPVLALMGPESEVARVVEEANCGIRVAIGDVDKLVESLTALSADASDGQTSQYDTARIAAREVFDRHYSVVKTTEALRETLVGIARRKP